jgi:hypothetical protein
LFGHRLRRWLGRRLIAAKQIVKTKRRTTCDEQQDAIASSCRLPLDKLVLVGLTRRDLLRHIARFLQSPWHRIALFDRFFDRIGWLGLGGGLRIALDAAGFVAGLDAAGFVAGLDAAGFVAVRKLVCAAALVHRSLAIGIRR